jgi:hypothetical protein
MDSESLSNLPKVTQLMSDEVGTVTFYLAMTLSYITWVGGQSD